MSNTFENITQSTFRKYAKGFASAKDNLQLALGAAVYQAVVHSNPNWLNELFDLAGFWTAPINGRHQVSTDGRVIYAYLTTSQDDGGCGLSKDIIMLDREKKAWTFPTDTAAKKALRNIALNELDKDFLFELLETVRFDRWGKGPVAPKAYSPKAALDKMQKSIAKAITAGELDQESLEAALTQVIAIEKALRAAIRPRKVTLPAVPTLEVKAA